MNIIDHRAFNQNAIITDLHFPTLLHHAWERLVHSLPKHPTLFECLKDVQNLYRKII